MTVNVKLVCDSCGAGLGELDLPDGVGRAAINRAVVSALGPDLQCPDCGSEILPPEQGEVVEVPDAPPP